MRKFIFKNYVFNETSREARFEYVVAEDSIEHQFLESVTFQDIAPDYNREVLDRAMFLAFVLVGTSYYKAFPTPDVVFEVGYGVDGWMARFFDLVYQEGLGQFAFENNLTRSNLARFNISFDNSPPEPVAYSGDGILSLQSGGKDSLLTLNLLRRRGLSLTMWYLGNSEHLPQFLTDTGVPLVTAKRRIDRLALEQAHEAGGLNGHVPVTYIVQSLALVQAILLKKNTILTSIGHEGEEEHAKIGDLLVNHQWSKTWLAEQKFAEYVGHYVSPDIKVGSPLRSKSELKIAEEFVQYCWSDFGHKFSSCNVANYKQGADNSELHWCGECPKCANSFLLFAPFLPPAELESLFADENLFQKPSLTDIFKGLLGVDGKMKPFECVGEVAELRTAYYMALGRGYEPLPFTVPESAGFDYHREYPSQEMLQ